MGAEAATAPAKLFTQVGFALLLAYLTNKVGSRFWILLYRLRIGPIFCPISTDIGRYWPIFVVSLGLGLKY